MRGEIDSVRNGGLGAQGAAAGGRRAGAGLVTAWVPPRPSARGRPGERAVYVSVDRSAWDPALLMPYDPDAT